MQFRCCVLMLAVLSLFVGGRATSEETEWEPYEASDPFTDVVRKGARLHNVSIWCSKENRLDKKRLHGAIFTERTPETRCGTNQFVGTYCQVRVEFRFDNQKSRAGQFNRTED